ncbi:MAG TPA: hypothetical protein VEA39_04470 [Methylophilaceae bacterium]|nr:hypothetical protein [Methylophilaceae bacterium]
MPGDEVVVKDADYYMEHPEEFEAMSEEARTALLFGGASVKGDTTEKDITADTEVIDDKVDTAAAPDAATDKDKTETKTDADTGKTETVDDTPVVQAKDGKNIIPYSELESARNKNTALEAEIQKRDDELLKRDELIASLQKAQQKDEGTGDTKAQQAVLDALNEDFPDLAQKMAPLIGSLIKEGVEERVSALKAELESKIQPLQKTAELTAEEKHFAMIAGKHEDYQTVFESKEFKDWMESQPSFAQPGIQAILDKGTAVQVIELLDTYKGGTAQKDTKGGQLTQEELAAKAKAEAAKAKPPVPGSLSEIPAGSNAHHDASEALLESNGLALVNTFLGKTPKQIEEMTSKVI